MFQRFAILSAPACVYLLLAIASANVSAMQVRLTAVTTLLGSDNAGANIDIPGTAFGDTLTITVIVDNGGSSILSQT